MTKVYYALGLMSNSSLDGLDIAYCRMDWNNKEITRWELIAAATMPYSEIWRARIAKLPEQDAQTFAKSDTYFGYYMGELVQLFLKREGIQKVDYVASHGHTIFHEPNRRYTSQIGKGAALAAYLKTTVVTDFRSTDVSCQGEGAPLTPLAYAYLFKGYDYYLNIGSVANLSVQKDNKWKAFDVVPANQALNFLANEVGLAYDEGGQLASQGNIDQELLAILQQPAFYKRKPPKSLGSAWVQQNLLAFLTESTVNLSDRLATVVEFIIIEIGNAVERLKIKGKMLVTGGGAFNQYLISRLTTHLDHLGVQIVLPAMNIIEFKESLLMALLGLLRLEKVPNSWPEITGATNATINGAVYLW